MMFKNSLKLFCSNFDKYWKMLFYNIIILGIIILLAFPFFEIIKEVILANFGSEFLKGMPSGLLYGSNVGLFLVGVFSSLSDTVIMLATKDVFAFCYIAFLLFILLPFLINVGKYAVGEMLYSYMSSQSKTSFCAVLVKTLGKSCVYSISKTFLQLPIKVGLFSLIFLIAQINFPYFEIFLPFLLILAFSLLVSSLQILTFGWLSAKVVYNSSIAKSYRIGFSAVLRRFARVFSTIFIVNLIFSLLVMGFGLISTVIFIPFYLCLMIMLEMVMFFGSQGMRYYVDQETVLTPKKLEQQDGLDKTKYIL